uniref:Uncharacterized protein n=1 Tax=Physcomitrium patens TaxID=3218 RepID=A0A2K1IU76_PHYPA|nr:hypothetical protein PHYPA_024767 [Physcomitrium patens]
METWNLGSFSCPSLTCLLILCLGLLCFVFFTPFSFLTHTLKLVALPSDNPSVDGASLLTILDSCSLPLRIFTIHY